MKTETAQVFPRSSDRLQLVKRKNHRPIGCRSGRRAELRLQHSVFRSLTNLKAVILLFSLALIPLLVTGIVSAGTPDKSKTKAPKIAKPVGNDQQNYSLLIEPESHPFCECGENEKLSERKEESALRPLLVPNSCNEEAGVRPKYNWDLSSEPLVPEGWPKLPVGHRCLDGKADVLLERAFRFGFCDWMKNDVPLNSVKAPDPTFVLTDADYYIIHVVSWKANNADITFDETKAVSSFHSFKPEETLFLGSEMTITTKDPDTGEISHHTHTFTSATKIKDILSSITDSKTKVTAILDDGQISISLPAGASVAGTGMLEKWISPIKSVSYKVESSRWYSYNRGDHRHLRQPLPLLQGASLRIYGTKKPIGLIAVHIRPKSEDESAEHDRELWENFRSLQVKYEVNVQKKVAANINDLMAAASIIFNAGGGPTAEVQRGTALPDGFYGATFFNAKTPSDITVGVQIDFPASQKANPTPNKNQPAPGNVQSSADPKFVSPASTGIEVVPPNRARPRLIETLLRQPTASEQSGSGQTANSPQTPANGSNGPTNTTGGNQPGSTKNKSQTQVPTGPSVDCQPKTSSGQQSECKMEATYSNEDLYHWDISFGVPFKALKELTYNADTGSGSIVPKTVKHENAYVFADIFPIAADIVSPPWLTMPHLMLGLPISGKVFNKPIFAVGDGFNLKKIRFLNAIPLQIQFFAGVAYNKEFRQIPRTTGPANVFPHRVWTGVYGVEIPVSQFKGLLSAKSKSANQSSSKTQSTGGSSGPPN